MLGAKNEDPENLLFQYRIVGRIVFVGVFPAVATFLRRLCFIIGAFACPPALARFPWVPAESASAIILTYIPAKGLLPSGYLHYACRHRTLMMPVRKIRTFAVILVLSAAALPARSEVIDADNNGFTVRNTVTIAADRLAVYVAVVANISDWWNADHTMSGNAANLYIDTELPGCFCETLGKGSGLVHMQITFANPGVLLRMTGGLGPLGLMGVAGNMTWEFDETDGVTELTLQYAVGGYMPGGLDAVAPAVDGVLIDAMTRLKSFVEGGSADGQES
jgi:hypothetical protein